MDLAVYARESLFRKKENFPFRRTNNNSKVIYLFGLKYAHQFAVCR